jgi:hypothetical protein
VIAGRFLPRHVGITGIALHYASDDDGILALPLGG